MTLKDNIIEIWPKLLDWLDREAKIEEIIKHSVEITPLETEYLVSHEGIIFNATDGEYRLVFSVKMSCVKIKESPSLLN